MGRYGRTLDFSGDSGMTVGGDRKRRLEGKKVQRSYFLLLLDPTEDGRDGRIFCILKERSPSGRGVGEIMREVGITHGNQPCEKPVQSRGGGGYPVP